MPYSRRRQTELANSGRLRYGLQSPAGKQHSIVQRTSFAGPLQHEGGLVAVMAAPQQSLRLSLAVLVQEVLL